jgi:hypothetical protein
MIRSERTLEMFRRLYGEVPGNHDQRRRRPRFFEWPQQPETAAFIRGELLV